MTRTPVPITRSTHVLYGLGSIAYGVKDNGFSFLLMLFYSQVLGLSAALAGLALFIALIFDAVSDPLVGFWSDNTRSRWGRRHPFMYFAALPVAVTYYFLWNPPIDTSDQTTLFLWLVGASIGIRFLITLYEIPSTALVAELTTDYDERTKLLGYRYMFGWYGGLTVHFMAFSVFLVDSPEYPSGVLNPAGYASYGLVAAALIFLSIMVSTLGLHRYIPQLREAPVRSGAPPLQVAKDLLVTLSNRNLLALFVAGVFAAIGAGVVTNFDIYMNTYFWEFTSSDIQWITLSLFGSAFLAMVCAPIITARFDKKYSAMGIYIVSIVWGTTPVVLRMGGWFPDNDWAGLLPLMIGFTMINVMLIVMFGIIQSSMLADVVEHSELRTGRREEGLFFAARTFAAKATSGVGTLLAGIILDLIAFPRGAQPGAVSEDVLFDLGLAYGPTVAVLYLLALACMSFYRISRSDHGEHLDTLRLAAGARMVDGTPGLPESHAPITPDLART
ncbi:MAG TPA: MFS transporter [Pseudomonadales bacterium]|nr:MFS transporter [Pseudomonadales bacterium]